MDCPLSLDPSPPGRAWGRGEGERGGGTAGGEGVGDAEGAAFAGAPKSSSSDGRSCAAAGAAAASAASANAIRITVPPYRLRDSSQAFVNRFASSARRSISLMRMSVEFPFSISSKMRISSGYQTSAFFEGEKIFLQRGW